MKVVEVEKPEGIEEAELVVVEVTHLLVEVAGLRNRFRWETGRAQKWKQ